MAFPGPKGPRRSPRPHTEHRTDPALRRDDPASRPQRRAAPRTGLVVHPPAHRVDLLDAQRPTGPRTSPGAHPARTARPDRHQTPRPRRLTSNARNQSSSCERYEKQPRGPVSGCWSYGHDARRAHVARPPPLKRPEKARGSVAADLASDDVSVKTRALQAFRNGETRTRTGDTTIFRRAQTIAQS